MVPDTGVFGLDSDHDGRDRATTRCASDRLFKTIESKDRAYARDRVARSEDNRIRTSKGMDGSL